MSDSFEEKFLEAKLILDAGQPFWINDFLRPAGQDFATYLRDRGYAISHLNFSGEDVYAPLSYSPGELETIGRRRSDLRDAGESDDLLPIS